MKAIASFIVGVVLSTVCFYAFGRAPKYHQTAQGWRVQYSMPACPDGRNRYALTPDHDEADTFTLVCESPIYGETLAQTVETERRND